MLGKAPRVDHVPAEPQPQFEPQPVASLSLEFANPKPWSTGRLMPVVVDYVHIKNGHQEFTLWDKRSPCIFRAIFKIKTS